MWFASVMLTLVAVTQLVQGFLALFQPTYYAVNNKQLPVGAGYTAWGWIHLGLAALVFAATAGLYTARPWARLTGIVVAGLSSLVQLAFLSSYPWWGTMVIALNVLVIYAIAVHGSEMREPG
jgi:hypothetical protein